MAVGQKHEAYAAIGIQSANGTPVARTVFFDIVAESLARDSTRAMSARLGSASQRVHTEVMVKSGGSIEVEGNYEGHESLYKVAFGASSVSTSGANPYTHVVTLKKLTPTGGLSIEVCRDIATFLYADCKVNTVEWSQDPDGYMKVSFGILGRRESQVTATALGTFPSTLPIIGPHLSFTIDGSAAVLNNFRCTLDNKLGHRPQLGSASPKEVIRVGAREVTGSFEMDFEDVTQYNKFVSNASVALIATWASSPASFKLELPTVHLTGSTPVSSAGQGPFTVAFNFVALEATRAAMDELKLTIINSVVTVA
jgi:hypothetical protein